MAMFTTITNSTTLIYFDNRIRGNVFRFVGIDKTRPIDSVGPLVTPIAVIPNNEEVFKDTILHPTQVLGSGRVC
jgi:hypothetical protein